MQLAINQPKVDQNIDIIPDIPLGLDRIGAVGCTLVAPAAERDPDWDDAGVVDEGDVCLGGFTPTGGPTKTGSGTLRLANTLGSLRWDISDQIVEKKA